MQQHSQMSWCSPTDSLLQPRCRLFVSCSWSYLFSIHCSWLLGLHLLRSLWLVSRLRYHYLRRGHADSWSLWWCLDLTCCSSLAGRSLLRDKALLEGCWRGWSLELGRQFRSRWAEFEWWMNLRFELLSMDSLELLWPWKLLNLQDIGLLDLQHFEARYFDLQSCNWKQYSNLRKNFQTGMSFKFGKVLEQ